MLWISAIAGSCEYGIIQPGRGLLKLSIIIDDRVLLLGSIVVCSIKGGCASANKSTIL